MIRRLLLASLGVLWLLGLVLAFHAGHIKGIAEVNREIDKRRRRDRERLERKANRGRF